MDYDSIAKQFGGHVINTPTDYDSLASQYGGSVDQPKTPQTPIKLGKEGYSDALRETLKGTDWATRNIAGAGSALALALEGLKGSPLANPVTRSLFGEADPNQVAEQKVIAEEAPVGNIAGNVAILAPTAFIPGANTAAGAATIGAITGALMTPGDSKERLKAGALSALGGAAGAKLSSLMSGAKPIGVSGDVKALTEEGISLTPGQNIGGIFKTAEDKAASMPFIGSIIQNARKQGIEDFDKAAFNRVLDPLGKKATETGREGFAAVKSSIGQAYDDILPKLNNIHVDKQFMDDMINIRDMAKTLGPEKAAQLDAILERVAFRKFTDAGRMSGETMKDVESAIGQQASKYMKAADPDQRSLGDALREAQNSLRQMVQRTNPQYAPELQKINKAYADYARIRRAASMAGTAGQEGVFTPAQLNNAVRAMDATAGKGAYASGKARMQDLTDPAMRVMPSKVPDSGTAGRLMSDLTDPFNWPGLALKAGLSIPVSMAYSKTGAALINAMVNKGLLPASEAARLLVANNPGSLMVGGMALANLVRK